MSEHHNLIGGQWAAAASGKTFESRNPARTSEVIGTFPLSGAEDVEAAAKAARAAFETWSRLPAPTRGDILRRAGDLLTARKDELAREMTREMGKPFFETKGDVQEAIDTAYYSASETRRMFGHTVPSELPSKFNMTIRRPLGVVGVITAWNFPVAVPSWNLLPGLAAGCTFVFKPSEEAPHSGELFVRILIEAGVPEGVVNLVHGAAEAGAAIAEHPSIDAISFTGSSETGAKIGETCGRMLKRYLAEMGGKNPIIALEDADLDLVVEGVLWGAFGTTGQRCTATSRLIVHESIHDEVVERLKARAGALRLGYGNDDATEMGPVINAKSIDKIASYIAIGKQEGATRRARRPPRRRPGPEGRLLLAADHLHEREGRDAHRAGRDLRPRAERRQGVVVRGGRGGRQRRQVRPLLVHLHQRRARVLPRDARPGGGHHLHQRPHHRRRGAHAVWRRQGHRQRPPRGRLGGFRLLYRDKNGIR